MKNVQTKISDTEYALLTKRAAEEERTIQEVLREAISEYVVKGRVDPDDSLFSKPVAKKGAKNGSALHDKYIYGSGG